MLNLLHFNSLLQAKNEAELILELVKYTAQVGFRTVSCVLVQDRSDNGALFYGADNMPSAYQESYCSAELGSQDPVMQHLKNSSLPVIWDQQAYIAKNAGDLHDHMDAHGIGTGIAGAAHLPNGLHFCLGVDRESSQPIRGNEVNHAAAQFQLMFVHAQDAAVRIMRPNVSPETAQRPPLTPREREALAWRMEGKTAWETGVILGVSESTVVKFLSAATQKLGCINKDQAVVTAMRLGILR